MNGLPVKSQYLSKHIPSRHSQPHKECRPDDGRSLYGQENGSGRLTGSDMKKIEHGQICSTNCLCNVLLSKPRIHQQDPARKIWAINSCLQACAERRQRIHHKS